MTRDRLVGLFILLGLVVLAALTFMVGGGQGLLSAGYPNNYQTRMSWVDQLQVNDLIYLEGTSMDVGRVDGIKLVESRDGERFDIQVDFSVKDGFRPRTDSRMTLEVSMVLGKGRLLMSPGTPDAQILPDLSEVTAVEPIRLAKLVSAFDQTLADLKDGGVGRMLLGEKGLRDLVAKIEGLSEPGRLGKLLFGTEGQQSLAEFMKALEEGTRGEGLLAKVLKDEEFADSIQSAFKEVDETLSDFKELTGEIREGEGLIPRLFSDKELGEKVAVSIRNLEEVTTSLKQGDSALSRLITSKDMGESLDLTITNFTTFSGKLADGKGTLGRTIDDPELYDEATGFFREGRTTLRRSKAWAVIFGIGLLTVLAVK
jgi:phospholipid/cholesterol/gamma-HCH transport system substrate-binding protein